ncbi:hypothetical protein MKW92_049724, partial [Papaver armeniacum]
MILKKPTSPRFRHVFNMSNESGILHLLSSLSFSFFNLTDKWKLDKRVNGIFWILLINLGIFAADRWFHVLENPKLQHGLWIREIKGLHLYHSFPVWYPVCDINILNHLSSNLFFLYIFGKLVEEEEGNFALWTSYILTGVAANLVVSLKCLWAYTLDRGDLILTPSLKLLIWVLELLMLGS